MTWISSIFLTTLHMVVKWHERTLLLLWHAQGIDANWMRIELTSLQMRIQTDLSVKRPKDNHRCTVHSRALGVSWKVVSAFSMSWKRRREFTKAQINLGLRQRSLVADCLTRWGSMAKMASRIWELHNVKPFHLNSIIPNQNKLYYRHCTIRIVNTLIIQSEWNTNKCLTVWLINSSGFTRSVSGFATHLSTLYPSSVQWQVL